MRYVWLALVFAACDSSTPTSSVQGGETARATATPRTGASNGDDSTDDAGDDAGDGGARAWIDGGMYPDGVTRIVVTAKGGYPPPPYPGSTCTQADDTYTIVLPDRDLTWKVCTRENSGPYAFVTGQRTISVADYSQLDSAIHAIALTTKTPGPAADKAYEQAVFTTSSGDVTYDDDFYFSDPNDGKTYVSGIDDVLLELRKLTQ